MHIEMISRAQHEIDKQILSQGNAALQQLLAVESMDEPQVPSARHVYPDHSDFAPPVALPIEKDRVRLQASSVFFRV